MREAPSSPTARRDLEASPTHRQMPASQPGGPLAMDAPTLPTPDPQQPAEQRVAEALARVRGYIDALASVKNEPGEWPDDFSIDTALNHADETDHTTYELNESDLATVVTALEQRVGRP